MRKDPTEFRERFAKWKAGEKVYEAGLPKYGGGKGDIDFHDDVTKHIIRKEGVLAAPKDIGDGKITIGSGLTQQKYIDQYKRNGNKWSQKENYIAVKDTVRGFENSLRGILPEYDQYPAEMRKALIDIIYNIGEGGLKNSPKFLSAMKLHNWNEAKRLMDWDNSDPLFGNGARKRNAERAALFDAGLAHWSPAGPVELMMENKPVFVPQPVFVPLTKNNTDYSIETMTSPTIPLMLNSRNSGYSPLYGGSDYSFRLPSIKEVVERLLFLGLPKYSDGKSGSKRRYDYKYVQAGKDNGWERITDDEMSDVFLDFVARPKSRGGNTDTYNWNKQWALKGEPGLEIVSPEFDILTLGAGARINAATQTFLKSRKIANAIAKGIKENAIITGYNRNPVTKELGTLLDYQSYLDNVYPNSKITDVEGFRRFMSKPLTLYVSSKQNASSAPMVSWLRAQKPLSASEVFPNQTGEGWLKLTADRLGININHYYNNIITPEELAQSIKTSGFESFVPKTVYTEPAYLPSGFPYGLDKSRIFMPYDTIRKMPMMARYANLPEAEFRKIADNLIGSHEFIHWWNKQLAKNIRSGRMNVPKGYQEHELIWNGQNMPDGMDENALGKMVDYMTQSNGTESNARLGLLFNAFGIKKGQFTPQHINLAKKFYRKVFPDNQMQLFLNAIKDKDRFVKFANDNAGTLFGLTSAATLAIPQITNTQNELRNK